MSVYLPGFEGIEAEYVPARLSPFGDVMLRASVLVSLIDPKAGTASLGLSIEDARVLAEALPRILMLHDAAERLAAEKAVA
jgi:hypothetical protein